MSLADDLGTPYEPARPARRVVSLVPSLTESVAVSAPASLVGATDYCTHPPGLDIPRVKGTKWPDLDAIRALGPDLVLANAEENRAEDIAALRASGIAVWVTAPATVPAALDSLGRMLAALSVDPPDWLAEAHAAWRPEDGAAELPDGDAARIPEAGAVRSAPSPDGSVAVLVPIWRRPWMVFGRDTFAGDLLGRLGYANVYAGHAERYPRIGVELLRSAGAELVVLPDEPYAFTADDGPEAFADLPFALVSGRHLTWYGPSLVEARSLLAGQLAAPLSQSS